MCVHSCSIKSPHIIAILKTGKEDSIADKGPSINTEQGTISGDTVSTGNKDYIGAKGPSVNTDQGKMSGDKVPTGNKGFIAD